MMILQNELFHILINKKAHLKLKISNCKIKKNKIFKIPATSTQIKEVNYYQYLSIDMPNQELNSDNELIIIINNVFN